MLKGIWLISENHKLSYMRQRKKEKEEKLLLVPIVYATHNFRIWYLFLKGHICYLAMKFYFLNKQHNVSNLSFFKKKKACNINIVFSQMAKMLSYNVYYRHLIRSKKVPFTWKTICSVWHHKENFHYFAHLKKMSFGHHFPRYFYPVLLTR